MLVVKEMQENKLATWKAALLYRILKRACIWHFWDSASSIEPLTNGNSMESLRCREDKNCPVLETADSGEPHQSASGLKSRNLLRMLMVFYISTRFCGDCEKEWVCIHVERLKNRKQDFQEHVVGRGADSSSSTTKSEKSRLGRSEVMSWGWSAQEIT